MFITVKRNINPSTVISLIALFVALGGTAWAIGKGSVKSQHIAKNAVKSKHINQGAVKSKQIANKSITSADIGKSSISGLQIATSAVESDEIEDSSIKGKDIDRDTIDGENIKNATISGSKIKSGSITSSDIQLNTFEDAGEKLSATVTQRSATFSIQPDDVASKDVQCSPDERATGGGWAGIFPDNSNIESANDVAVIQSGLISNGWGIIVINTSNKTDIAKVNVVCVKVS